MNCSIAIDICQQGSPIVHIQSVHKKQDMKISTERKMLWKNYAASDKNSTAIIENAGFPDRIKDAKKSMKI